MMSARGMERLVFACIAIALLLALVSFLKVMLSDAVATFVAGLGIGALGVFALVRANVRAGSRPD
jgi:hypothetical protein